MLNEDNNEDKLKGSVGIILYELWMLKYCANKLSQLSHNQEYINALDQEDKNLLVEGLVLHTRVLRDFFFTKHKPSNERNTWPNDVVAVDYFSSSNKWIYNSNELSPYLSEHKLRMDRAIAHLSTARIEYEQDNKGWDVNKLRSEIFEKWFEFIETLSKDNSTRATWFSDHQRAKLVPFKA